MYLGRSYILNLCFTYRLGAPAFRLGPTYLHVYRCVSILSRGPLLETRRLAIIRQPIERVYMPDNTVIIRMYRQPR